MPFGAQDKNRTPWNNWLGAVISAIRRSRPFVAEGISNRSAFSWEDKRIKAIVRPSGDQEGLTSGLESVVIRKGELTPIRFT